MTTQQTSLDAFVSIQPHLQHLERTVLDTLTRIGACATFQIESITGLSGNTVRPRLVSLRKLRLVRDSGRRVPTPSGRTAIVWEVAR